MLPYKVPDRHRFRIRAGSLRKTAVPSYTNCTRGVGMRGMYGIPEISSHPARSFQRSISPTLSRSCTAPTDRLDPCPLNSNGPTVSVVPKMMLLCSDTLLTDSAQGD